MSAPPRRRALTIDDHVGGREACHVAHPPSGLTDGRVAQIDMQDIRPNPDQPRKHFNESALAALADSPNRHGYQLILDQTAAEKLARLLDLVDDRT